ncbi:MAG: MBL fold metallo-hydrolase [Provencibacterium sp.]|nr:MBL fold metallo-hydrolase [Provencibacterium sp.]
MQLIFLGADHEVTGSCHMLKACGKNILIDCGLEQGIDEYENQEIPVAPSAIDYILLTHAHIDHSGKLPLLYSQGFRGRVIATTATCRLCGIMLLDSAHIQMFEAEWRNRKGKRAGHEEYVPLYTTDDASGVLEQFEGCRYGEIIPLCKGLDVRFTDGGHLLGSASIEVFAEEEGEKRTIVFSGDIGNINQPLIRDPQYISKADYVVMESTYGTRLHNPPPDYVTRLADIIQKTFDRGGNLVIPSFAVGRTQELLYFLRKIKADGLIQGHEGFPVYVDSPLAIEAANIFNENVADYFDEEAMELVQQGINPIGFADLKTAVSSEESRQINFDRQCKVIISASGMCEAGRIKHHLKHNLWRPESTVLFVGYQAAGTLGRSLQEGAKRVRLFSEEIEVKAEIATLEGVSGHADKLGLLRYIHAFSPKPKRVFVVHGSTEACDAFTACLREDQHYTADAPYSGAVYDLVRDVWLNKGERIEVKRPAAKRLSDVFTRLVAAGKRLMAVIEQNRGGSNKELARFTSQIHALCDKWER